MLLDGSTNLLAAVPALIAEEINVISLSWWKKLGLQFFIKIYILTKSENYNVE